jgi:hypothetical protein
MHPNLLLRALCIVLSLQATGQSWTITPSGDFQGIQDATGGWQIPAVHDKLGWTDGSAEVRAGIIGYQESNKWGLLNVSKNKRITPAIYEKLFPINDDLFVVAISGRLTNRFFYGIIDHRGKLRLNLQYFAIKPAGKHILLTRYENQRFRMGAMNTRLEFFMPLDYEDILFSNDRFIGRRPEGLFDFYNHAGKAIVKKVETVTPETYGWVVQKDGAYGLISSDGKSLEEVKYKEINKRGNPMPFDRRLWMSNTRNRSFLCDSIRPFGPLQVLSFRNGRMKIEGSASAPEGSFQLHQQTNDWVIVQSGLTGEWRAFHRLGDISITNEDSLRWEQGYVMALRSGGWQIFNHKGLPVNTQYYQQAKAHNSQFLSVKKYNYWALLDGITGQMSTFRYDSIAEVWGQKARVKYVGQWGVMLGEDWLIPPAYDHISYEKEHFIARKQSAYTLFNTKGQRLYQTLDEIAPAEGYFTVRYENKFTAIGPNGRPISNTIYDEIEKTGNRFVVRQGDQYHLLDARGKKISLSHSAEWMGDYGEDRIAIKKNGKYGFVDLNGKLRIAHRYDSVRPSNGGLAPVMLKGKWGLINHDERIVVQPFYDHLSRLPQGLYIFHRDGKLGLVDEEGKERLPGIYRAVTPTPSGALILVSENGRYGLADSYGRILLSPNYTELRPMDKYFIAGLSGKRGVIDGEGQLIIDFAYDSISFNQGVFILKEEIN